MRFRWIWCMLAIGFSYTAVAQEKLDFNTAVEAIYKRSYTTMAYDQLLDHLWNYYQHPINVNKASRQELRRLYILSDQQLDNLFIHLHKNGSLVSIYELQAIPTFDKETIGCLLPFIQIIETYPSIQGIGGFFGKKPSQGYWLVRYGRILERQKGYQINPVSNDIPYQGSPNKVATRIKWQAPNGWSYSLTGRKYAGESFTWDPSTQRYGMDSWSAYAMVERKSFLKKLIVGHYQVGYGQGLVTQTGVNLGNTAVSSIICSNQTGLKPHTSFTTYGWRGLGFTWERKGWEQTIYYAYNELDGRLWKDADAETIYIKTVGRGGLHRTRNEIEKKGNIDEQIIGTAVAYKSKGNQGEVGAQFIYNHYDFPIYLDKHQPAYHFTGNDNYVTGFFYRYLWKNLHFFGEGARSKSGGLGGITGIIASLTAFIDLSALWRYYEPTFHSLYGKAFGENTPGNHNETGFYVGLGLSPTKKLRINGYYDYFNFFLPTRTIPQPSDGYKWLVRSIYQIDRTRLVQAHYSEHVKARRLPRHMRTQADDLDWVKTRKCKLGTKQPLISAISTHTEIQTSLVDGLEEYTWGYALSQQIICKIKRASLTAQVAWFDATLDNRLYFYEKSTLYSPPIPILYYKQGIKTYLLLSYKPTSRWRLEGRYSLIWLMNEDRINTGNERIMGSTKNEINLQMIYKI